MSQRREFFRGVGAWSLCGLAGPLLTPSQAAAQARQRVSLTVPGPGNLLYLPLSLAPQIGADAAEGLALDLRFVGGGPLALRQMLDRNSDFSAAGLSAAALQRISGNPLVCIAPLTRVPAYALLVRQSLRKQVRKISDLRGMVVGVKGYAPGGRSTSQLFTEFLLARAGLRTDEVNYVSVGQAFQNQQAALASGTVDALMGDEPFATQLQQSKEAFVLADFHDLKQTRELLGGLFLNACLTTRADMVAERPELVGKVVRMVSRSLVWLAQKPAAEVVSTLAVSDAGEREALLSVLLKHKGIFSPDGRLSAEQIASTERFLHATEPTPAAQAFKLQSMVNARWAGTSP